MATRQTWQSWRRHTVPTTPPTPRNPNSRIRPRPLIGKSSFDSSRWSSTRTNTLNVPTDQDAKELFLRMDSRPGSLIFNDQDLLPKYNQDWTVRTESLVYYEYRTIHLLGAFPDLTSCFRCTFVLNYLISETVPRRSLHCGASQDCPRSF